MPCCGRAARRGDRVARRDNLVTCQGAASGEAEGAELPADVRAAAKAIEASRMFRDNFAADHPFGLLHPAAVEFARLALQEASP